ncbi:hypothetical protein [Sinorhizobium meliloti]
MRGYDLRTGEQLWRARLPAGEGSVLKVLQIH